MTGYWLKVYSNLGGSEAGTAVLAFVTTIHFALVVLRKHRSHPRGQASLILFPSLVFAATPWFLASPLWLAVVLATHFAWFVACEKLVPPAAPAPKRPDTASHPAPATSVSSGATAGAAAASAKPKPRPAASPGGFHQVPVLAVLQETPEIRTFRFARPQGFDFKPGQFLMAKVELDGKPLIRCYSISSSPSASGYLEISVRKQGQVSGFLHATVRPGMTMAIKGPGGAFVYPGGSRPIVLLAAGIGITPLLCMLRNALDTEPTRPVTLLYSAKTEKQVAFLADLQLMARRYPLFRLAVALSQGSERQEFYSGRIDKNLVQSVVENVEESVYLICGPLPMIEEMEKLLSSLGVPRPQILFERFEAAVASAAAVASPAPADPALAAAEEPMEAQEAPACEGCNFVVRLQKRGKAVTVQEGQSILEAAEAAGEELPSMCRAGACGTCKMRVIEGEVEGDFDLVDEKERAEGYILSCVARPVKNTVVDA